MEASNVDIVRDLQMIAVWMVIIGVIDIACQKLGWFPEKKSNSRYFTLHVIVNAYVTVIHFKVSFCFQNLTPSRM